MFSEDPTIPVLLISMKCGSLGLNITAASNVILVDPWWNPTVEDQAISRSHRFGQKKNVTVWRLMVPETIEDRILELQEKKRAIAEAALGDGNLPVLAKLTLADFVFLFAAPKKRPEVGVPIPHKAPQGEEEDPDDVEDSDADIVEARDDEEVQDHSAIIY